MNDSDKTNDPHDVRLKELFKNKDAFISLLKDCVKADWVNDLDTDSLKLSNHSFILQDFKKKEADVVYEATIRNGKEKVIFYVLLELQKKVDYRMNYRLLLYIVEILRHYYNQSDVKARKRRNFKFPAIFPIVFFNGSQKWTVPLNLKEMFAGHKRFGDYLINFDYALVDVKWYNDESVKNFRSKLLKVMMMFEKSKGFINILETVKKYKDEVVSLNDEEKRVLSVALDIFGKIYGQSQNYNLNEIIETENAERVNSMLVDVIANAKNYEKNLIRKGKKESQIEMAKEMLIDGEPMSKIIKYTKLTEKEIKAVEKTLQVEG